MSVSNKIRALLNLKDMKPQNLSTCLGISVQAVRNKFTRDSFSVADLIKIASYLDCELLFKLNESQKIKLSQEDLKAPTGTHEVPRIPTETDVDSIPQTTAQAEPGSRKQGRNQKPTNNLGRKCYHGNSTETALHRS